MIKQEELGSMPMTKTDEEKLARSSSRLAILQSCLSNNGTDDIDEFLSTDVCRLSVEC